MTEKRGYLPLAPGVSTVRCPIPQRTFKYAVTVQGVTDETCQEKTSSYRILRGRIAIDARSGQLPRTTDEDECWRSQSDSDHRLDGGVRPLNTTFGFR